jgi:SAM-dependent methyltransferase
VREWLSAMAAGGYVAYDAESQRFHLEPEQALVLASDQGPAYVPGAYDVVLSVVRDMPRIADVVRSGEGFAWHEHDHSLFEGTERFFRPGYATHLVPEWLPALEDVTGKLERGARVADIGCGCGASTILMAQAFPRSRFIGSDYHEASIEQARRTAEREGVADRVAFEVATAQSFDGEGYDLVCVFDALHDMGDPVGAAAHVRETLEPDGTWMIVEPFAHDRLADNLNPVGRIYYAASTMVCTPASLAQEVGLGLGAQAGERRLREVVTAGGFTRFRRAAETPFNLVLEARP